MKYGRDLFEFLSSGEVADWVRPEVVVEDLQEQFDRIWPDVVLGLATQDEIDLARNLRKQIKAMK